jgi:sugar O-acyltransferase (sialic acid O-acetyltransferase NeuD family)
MLIIGAKGFAKEILDTLSENELKKGIYFYDDINSNESNVIFNNFKIIKNKELAENYFKTIDVRYTLGLGGVSLRKKISDIFTSLGGELTSTISTKAHIGGFTNIKQGCNILPGSCISNGVSIGIGALIYYNVIITHDVRIGDFVELSPGCKLLGRVVVGNFVTIGSGAIILPDIIIGDNVVIGAGAVVTKNIPNNSTVIGIPAKPI